MDLLQAKIAVFEAQIRFLEASAKAFTESRRIMLAGLQRSIEIRNGNLAAKDQTIEKL